KPPELRPLEVRLEQLEDLLGAGSHLVDEVAAVKIEPLRPQKPGTGMALHYRHAGLQPVGEHRPTAGFDQPHGGDLVPGKQRALAGAAEDHALVHSFKTRSHRTAHDPAIDLHYTN